MIDRLSRKLCLTMTVIQIVAESPVNTILRVHSLSKMMYFMQEWLYSQP